MTTKVPRISGKVVALQPAALLVVACGATPEPTAAPTVAQPTLPPTQAVDPTLEPTAAEPAPPPQEAKLFPPEMPSAIRGQSVFEANCASCHGLAGDGSAFPGAADFTDVAFMRAEQPAEFFEAIRDGVEGTAMPAWADQLSEIEIWDVIYYVWTLATSPE